MGYRNNDTGYWGCMTYLGLLLLMGTFRFINEPKLNFLGILTLIGWIVIGYLFTERPLTNFIRSNFKKIEKCEHGIRGGETKMLCQICRSKYDLKQELLNNLNKLESERQILIDNNLSLISNLEKEIQKKLNSDIQYLRKIDPFEFENIVAKLYNSLGYKYEVTSKSNDEGKDIILKKNGVITYVECKRFSKGNNVSRPILQKLYGVMVADNVTNGIIVTTSNFTKEAIDFSKKMDCNIQLIGEKELIKMLNDYSDKNILNKTYKQYCSHNLYRNLKYNSNQTLEELKNIYENYDTPCGELIDVSYSDTEVICKNNHKNINQGKKIYKDLLSKDSNSSQNFCPKCGKIMVKKKQRNSNKKFWGCSGYPYCTYTKSLK